ncbi:MAG: hypothetical protein FJY97_06900 [candidate division Zixibacteria bacterium]|nr:hypothetical protein [candidate division Zixibacteria bacterium]
MKTSIQEWLKASREKLLTAALTGDDLDRLEELLADRPPTILYLTARSTNPRSGIVGWVVYDPLTPKEPMPLSSSSPYACVLDAVADGWQIVQYPIPKLYEYKDLENDYIGFDFILEKHI